jgi:two-component system NarL family sensor kinase
MISNVPSLQYPFLIGALLFGLFVVFFVVFILMYHKAQQKMLAEREMLRKAIMLAEIEMREQTLKQVSQELHDNLGQLTSLISMNLKILGIQVSAEQSNRISEIQTLVSQLIHDIKNLSYSLNGKGINQYGLAALLQREIDRVNRTGLIQVQANLNEDLLSQIPTIKALGLFRVIQELLNNTLKHSRAVQCTLTFSLVDAQLHMQYSDNGVGFEPETKGAETSGLKNMSDRCRQMSGQFNLISAPGKGMKVHVYLNLQNEISSALNLNGGKSDSYLPGR